MTKPTKEYREGAAARRAGLRRNDNPYRMYVIQATDWSLGWYDAA